jgi:glycosyltransferase involved in cell wall biosynthesis
VDRPSPSSKAHVPWAPPWSESFLRQTLPSRRRLSPFGGCPRTIFRTEPLTCRSGSFAPGSLISWDSRLACGWPSGARSRALTFTAALRADVPYIVTPHGALDPWLSQNSPVVKRVSNLVWQQAMLSKAAAIHFTTQEEADLAGDINATRHVVIPNGIDLSRFRRGRSGNSFRERYLAGYRGQMVLFFGRIAKKKGIDLLIRGFAQATAHRNSLLVIAGPDDEGLRPSLAGLAETLGISSRVRFVGALYGEDQLDALAAAEVWALTSYTENFGNAVVEAMAAGCPVLVSTEVNIAGQLAAAGAGVVTSLSVAEIAGALSALLDDRERRATLTVRGRSFVERFDWSVVAPELLSMFREIASAARGAAATDDSY